MQTTQSDPLRWPPDPYLARKHYNCNQPGIQDPDSQPCPCCGKKEKIRHKLVTRSISKHFNKLGGGVPAYFNLLVYFIAVLMVIVCFKVIYHIWLLEKVCPYFPAEPGEGCTEAFTIFKFCDSQKLYQKMEELGWMTEAHAFEALEITSYIILIAATVGIKVLLQKVNQNKVSLDEKLFSRFALMFKNVPLYYSLQDLKEELKEISDKIQVLEIFYVHKTHRYDTKYRQLVDLCFKLNHVEKKNQLPIQEIRKIYEEYIQLYDEVESMAESLSNHTKKVIVVFNTTEQRELVHRTLRINELKKFIFYTAKMIGYKGIVQGYFTESLPQPEEIYWKFIGESSTQKQKVRLQTTLIGLGVTVLCFAVFYFPMIKINEEKIQDPTLGTVLGIAIALMVTFLMVATRQLISKLTTQRRPSSKLAEYYFVVMTLIVFFILFYLVSTAAFYIFVPQIPINDKLKTFFMAVIVFLAVNIIMAALDIPYLRNKGRRQNLVTSPSAGQVYCQRRLHEEISFGRFPVQMRILTAFNIWSFNSFFIFQIPYLLIIFAILLAALYWIDKYNLFNHYNTNHYLSIEFILQIQKVYIFIFLLCVSVGFFLSAQWVWQKYMIVAVFVISMTLNAVLVRNEFNKKEEILRKKTDITTAVKKSKTNVFLSFRQELARQNLKTSFVAPIHRFSRSFQIENVKLSLLGPPSMPSQRGPQPLIPKCYQATYDAYLNQFRNQKLNEVLEHKYIEIRRTRSKQSRKRSALSELSQIAVPPPTVRQRLLDDALPRPSKYLKDIEAIEEQVGLEDTSPTRSRMRQSEVWTTSNSQKKSQKRNSTKKVIRLSQTEQFKEDEDDKRKSKEDQKQPESEHKDS